MRNYHFELVLGAPTTDLPWCIAAAARLRRPMATSSVAPLER